MTRTEKILAVAVAILVGALSSTMLENYQLSEYAKRNELSASIFLQQKVKGVPLFNHIAQDTIVVVPMTQNVSIVCGRAAAPLVINP